jgi:hypothetical protein
MPRYARRVAPGSVQHLISRFVNREFLLDAEGARDEYLRRVAAAIGRSDWRPLAFALMSSHVHWVLEAGELPSCSFVKPLHCGFAGWLNRTQGRLGPVFADRHRTLTFVGGTAAPLISYVHNNPVRAGLVRDASKSAWTSHRAYLGVEPAPPWLDVKRGLALAGFSDTRAGRRAFDGVVSAQRREVRCSLMSGDGMPQHRARARLDAQAPVEVGTPTVAVKAGRRTMVVPTIVPADCHMRRNAKSTTASVISAVARAVGISTGALRSSRRVSDVVSGRRLALLIWVRHLDRPAVQMARALGIAGSTASELLASASLQIQQSAFEIASGSVAFGRRR